ncbi:MAG: hypothetical protein JO048_12485, partial [Methylobacteriaceae bacterium]|nr:hypothetical protein [Methylobacteriaceae bacterium]
MTQTNCPPRNRLLASLPQPVLGRLMDELEEIPLETGQVVERDGSDLREVVFMQAGVASILAEGAGVSVEVGMVGRDGMTGL